MEPIDEKDIRASFINCSKGEAKRITCPGGWKRTNLGRHGR
jgi:hypothetical protein